MLNIRKASKLLGAFLLIKISILSVGILYIYTKKLVMVYFDSQLFQVDGLIQDAGASYTVSLNDLIYCLLSSAKDNSGSTVDTFMCLIDEPNKMSLTKVHYRRNSRTMTEFLAAMNAVGGGSPLKLWTDLRSFSGNELHSSDALYDSDLILNDNYQSNCIYSSTTGNTTVYFGRKNDPSPTTFIVSGDQIGSAYLVEDIVLPVYDNLSAEGTTSSSTTILKYGVNVIETVTDTNYAAKLPQPKTGKSVKVMNKGTAILSLYPSNVGGQINNLPIDDPAIIPPDGKLYEFVCIENPLPGAWTWNAPAIGQYDSGDITTNVTLGVNAVICAIDSANFSERSGFLSSSSFSFDGKNNPLTILSGLGSPVFKPQYNAIAKIKVYTNLSSNNAGILYKLGSSSQLNYYNISTGAFITNGVGGGGNYGGYGYCDQTVPGATLGLNALAANIGDPGTCWGELILIGNGADYLSGVDSRVGDYNLGIIVNPNLPTPPPTVRSWLSSYINLQIQPRVNLTGFMFRFFIEYY